MEYLICKFDFKTTLFQVSWHNGTAANTINNGDINFIKGEKYPIVNKFYENEDKNLPNESVLVIENNKHNIYFSQTPNSKRFEYYGKCFYHSSLLDYENAKIQLENIPINLVEKFLREKKLKSLQF